MTVLAACQSAMLRLNGGRPATIFSSQNQMEMEVVDLANEVATDIMKEGDWRALTTIATIAGDGTDTSFPLPADYDRMVASQPITDPTSWLWGYTGSGSLEEWMQITSGRVATISPGFWIALGGEIQFYPAPPSTREARFAYISNSYCRTGNGSITGVFTKDDDTFRLSERLLTLGIIWRFKAQKGFEYAEDMATYEKALSQELTRDKGARVIAKRPDRFSGVPAAWPWELGGS